MRKMRPNPPPKDTSQTLPLLAFQFVLRMGALVRNHPFYRV
jgi:hypothetical protein